MSIGSLPPPPPRVRDQARDAIAVMTFSVATSVALSGAFLLLTSLGR